MKIIVLVKEVPDTYGERRLDAASGRLDRSSGDQILDEIDERAIEIALRVKDRDDSEVVLLAMGPVSATNALRKGLSMGADRAVHVVDDALEGSDITRTARTLAAAVLREPFDLVVAGSESTDGGSGVVPAMLAELLGVPLLSFLGDVEVGGQVVRGTRTADGVSTTLRAALPAVVSVAEQAAEARFPDFKGIMTAKRKPLETVSTADLGVTVPEAHTEVLTTTERPPRTAGEKIVDTGEAGTSLAEYLISRKLVRIGA